MHPAVHILLSNKSVSALLTNYCLDRKKGEGNRAGFGFEGFHEKNDTWREILPRTLCVVNSVFLSACTHLIQQFTRNVVE